MKKRFWLILLILCCAVGALVPVYYHVSEEKTLEIHNREEFAQFVARARAGEAVHARLKTDIDLGGAAKSAFVPVPLYCGELDGENHKISGLRIDNPEDGALFLKLDGTVKNLAVEGAVSAQNAAAIAVFNYGTIENVQNRAKIDGSDMAAGIAVYNYGYLTACTNTGTVSTSRNGRYIGGIAAMSAAGDTNGNAAISGCANAGQIGASGKSAPCAGGICGFAGAAVISGPPAVYGDPEAFSYETQKLTGISSAANARQLGGYPVADGKQIKKNLLLRTAELSWLSQEEMEVLRQTYHLSYVVDLRGPEEIEDTPDKVIPGVEYVQCPVYGEDVYTEDTKRNILPELDDLSGAKEDLAMAKYRLITERSERLPLSETAQEAYAEFFEILLNAKEGEAVLWHCSAGKDRTGLAAALLLSALGADEGIILKDYAITNEAMAEEIAKDRQEVKTRQLDQATMDEYLTAASGVHEKFLRLSLESIKNNYGSVQAYLNRQLGVSDEEIQALRDKFLEDRPRFRKTKGEREPADQSQPARADTASAAGPIVDSSNEGKVYGGKAKDPAASGVGGIVGFVRAGLTERTISGCINHGTVIGKDSENVGGIAGYCLQKIADCEDDGIIQGGNRPDEGVE